MTNEMPNEITVWRNGKLYCRDESVSSEPIHSKSTITKYIRADIAQKVNQELESLKHDIERYVKIAGDLATENEELLGALKWYVDNDDTYEGDRTSYGGINWDEENKYWLKGRRRAEQAIARAEQKEGV